MSALIAWREPKCNQFIDFIKDWQEHFYDKFINLKSRFAGIFPKISVYKKEFFLQRKCFPRNLDYVQEK